MLAAQSPTKDIDFIINNLEQNVIQYLPESNSSTKYTIEPLLNDNFYYVDVFDAHNFENVFEKNYLNEKLSQDDNYHFDEYFFYLNEFFSDAEIEKNYTFFFRNREENLAANLKTLHIQRFFQTDGLNILQDYNHLKLNSGFVNLFIDNNIKTLSTLKKIKSLYRKNKNLTFFKIINFVLRQGKKEKATALFFSAFYLCQYFFTFTTKSKIKHLDYNLQLMHQILTEDVLVSRRHNFID